MKVPALNELTFSIVISDIGWLEEPLRVTDIQLTAKKKSLQQWDMRILKGDFKDSNMRKLVFGASGVCDHML